MGFGLTRTTVTLDDNEFEAFKNEETDMVYFAERINIKGIFNFGRVAKGDEVKIDLEANGITTPVTIEKLFAFTKNGASDEVYLNLYYKTGGREIRIGRQRISAGQMPYYIPNGILTPEMVLGVQPSKADATVVAYIKPVAVTFEAVPNPTPAGE